MISLKYGWEWLRRFRNRCGYGIHSPFAFNFVTGVVFERGAYYAYQSLDKQYNQGVFRAFSHARKCHRFLFRLANFVHPDAFYCDSSVGAVQQAYLQAACSHAVWCDLSQLSAADFSCALVCCSSDTACLSRLLATVRQNASPASAVLITVRTATERRQCLSVLQESVDCVVSFDLYNYLLVFFDFDLHKQHYRINFLD